MTNFEREKFIPTFQRKNYSILLMHSYIPYFRYKQKLNGGESERNCSRDKRKKKKFPFNYPTPRLISKVQPRDYAFRGDVGRRIFQPTTAKSAPVRNSYNLQRLATSKSRHANPLTRFLSRQPTLTNRRIFGRKIHRSYYRMAIPLTMELTAKPMKTPHLSVCCSYLSTKMYLYMNINTTEVMQIYYWLLIYLIRKFDILETRWIAIINNGFVCKNEWSLLMNYWKIPVSNYSIKIFASIEERCILK